MPRPPTPIHEDIVDIDFADAPSLLEQLFRESKSDALLVWAEDRNMTEILVEGFGRLAAPLGGSIFERTATADEAVRMSSLKVLVGRRYHLKLRKTAWQMLASTIPLLVAVVAATVTPTVLAGALTGLISTLVGNLEKLSPEEWNVYLLLVRAAAENKGPVPRDLIRQQASPSAAASNTEPTVDSILDSMAAKGIVRKDASGRFSPVM